MGFAYNNRAGQILDVIEAACTAQGGGCNDYRAANGQRYFFEVARKDQADGGIRGTIHRFEGETTWARKVGGFHITGDGRLMKAPEFMVAAVEAHGKAGIDQRLARGIGGAMGTW